MQGKTVEKINLYNLLYLRRILIHLTNYEVVVFSGKVFSCIIWRHRISQQVVLGLHTISLVNQNNVHKPSVFMTEVDTKKCQNRAGMRYCRIELPTGPAFCLSVNF